MIVIIIKENKRKHIFYKYNFNKLMVINYYLFMKVVEVGQISVDYVSKDKQLNIQLG